MVTTIFPFCLYTILLNFPLYFSVADLFFTGDIHFIALLTMSSFVFYQHPRYLHILFFVSTIMSQIPVPSSTFVTLLSSVFQMFSFQEVHILQLFLQWRFLSFRINVPGIPQISPFSVLCLYENASYSISFHHVLTRSYHLTASVLGQVLLKVVNIVVDVDVNVDFTSEFTCA